MTNDIPCPQSDELRQLLDGSLSGQRQMECTQHMGTCGCCQSRLEDIATGGTKLTDIVKRLHEDEPMATSAYWPAMKALQGGAQQAIAQQAPLRAARFRSISCSRPATRLTSAGWHILT